MSSTERDKTSESTAELVKDLSREVSDLVRQEIALARAEMMEKGRKAGRGAGMLSGAAVFGLADSVSCLFDVRAHADPPFVPGHRAARGARTRAPVLSSPGPRADPPLQWPATSGDATSPPASAHRLPAASRAETRRLR